MTENLPKTLTCPSCGAPLDFDEKSALVRCKFCWRGERLYFEVDGIIYCVDVTTGKAIFHFR